MKRFVISFLSVCFVTSGSLFAETGRSHISVQLAPDGFKPWDPLSSSSNTSTFNSAVHKQPFYFTRDYRINPGYVKEWEWDFKRNLYVLTLDDTIKFHNGTKIRAADLEFALIKPFITKLDRWEKANLIGIKGVSKLQPGMVFKSGMAEGIKVISDTRIEIALENPNPVFLYSFSESVPVLGPVDSFKDDLYTPKTVPIGCGNYKMVSSDKGSSKVTVERAVKSNDKAVPESIDFFSHGDGIQNKADLAIAAGVAGLMESPNYKTYTGDVTLSIQVMDFNFSNKYAKERKYRQAIEMAIDKDAANQGYKFSRVADQLVASSFYGRAEKKVLYSPENAKKLLMELPEDFRKARHKAIYHGPKEKLPKYLVRIKDQLEKVGLSFDFIQTDQIKIEDKDQDIEMYIYGQSMSFVDPLNPFSFYLPGGINPNHAPKSDDKYVDLYKKAFNAPDIESRSIAIADLTEYCRTQVCQIQLFEDRPLFVYGKRIDSIGEEKLFLTFNFDLIKLNVKGTL